MLSSFRCCYSCLVSVLFVCEVMHCSFMNCCCWTVDTLDHGNMIQQRNLDKPASSTSEQLASYKPILTKAVESAWLHNATKISFLKCHDLYIFVVSGMVCESFRRSILFIHRKVFIIVVAVGLSNEIWRMESETCNITCEWRHLESYTLLSSPSTFWILYCRDYFIFKAPCLNVKKSIMYISNKFFKE